MKSILIKFKHETYYAHIHTGPLAKNELKIFFLIKYKCFGYFEYIFLVKCKNFGYSKERSHRDGSFEHPHYLFYLIGTNMFDYQSLQCTKALSIVSFVGMTLNKCDILWVRTLNGCPLCRKSPIQCRLKKPTVI